MSYPHQQWRLLITSASHGYWNMAVDEAVLQSISQTQSLPTLRLYAWDPPCLSIGYAQSFNEIDAGYIVTHGWEWVRRPTGGRAILHTDELTYSVMAPLAEPRIQGGVLESYQRISAALLAALHLLNIPAETLPLPPVTTRNDLSPVCFEVPSNYEIIVAGKKLLGSAQARRKEGFLQHGSLPLSGDLTRITKGIKYSNESERIEAATRLLAHATTVESVTSSTIDWDTAAQAFIDGFQSELNLELVKIDLSDGEIERINRLIVEKYNHPSWQERI